MYIILFALVIVYFIGTALVDARKIKHRTAGSVTTENKQRTYIDACIENWGSTVIVLIICLVANISFESIGLTLFELKYDLWFNIPVFVISGFVLLVSIYNIAGYSVSREFRKASQKKFTEDAEKGTHYDKVISELMTPSSKKEKRIFFFTALGAGVGEELVARGFLFFLLQNIFPGIHVAIVIIIGSVLFGFWHLYQGAKGVLSTGITGAIFGCLFVVTGSLIPGMVLHFIADLAVAFRLSDKEI